jgi:predicted negative regulator of RcsB-dependent stress response
LSGEADLDGAREAYRKAADAQNYDAPYALVIIGHILKAHGDAAGARTAYQQAIDAGYPHSEDLLSEASG